jgi:hypothetical protein
VLEKFIIALSGFLNVVLLAAYFKSRLESKRDNEDLKPVIKVSESGELVLKAYNSSDSPVFVESAPLLTGEKDGEEISIGYTDLEAEKMIEPQESRIVYRKKAIAGQPLADVKYRPVNGTPLTASIARDGLKIVDRSEPGTDDASQCIRKTAEMMLDEDLERSMVPNTEIVKEHIFGDSEKTPEQVAARVKKEIRD